jgi:hypothetical protein
MLTKTQKGKQIAKNSEIRFDGQGWLVPSQIGNGEYQVNLQDQTCTCLDLRKINQNANISLLSKKRYGVR